MKIYTEKELEELIKKGIEQNIVVFDGDVAHNGTTNIQALIDNIEDVWRRNHSDENSANPQMFQHPFWQTDYIQRFLCYRPKTPSLNIDLRICSTGFDITKMLIEHDGTLPNETSNIMLCISRHGKVLLAAY